MITTGMNVIRKLIYTAVMAVSALNLAPSMAAAQEPARGRFTLTHDVFWETAKVPAGDYSFSFGSNGISPVLILQKLNGTRAAFMLLVPATDGARNIGANRLVLETRSGSSYVSALQLPEFGMTLHFAVPTRMPEKQMAKTVTSAGPSGK